MVTESNVPESFIFIRHGSATEPQDFAGDDSDRPLTIKGIQKTKKAMDGLLSLFTPQRIVSSDFVRARETASILRDRMIKAGGLAPDITITESLRPDKTCFDFRAFINQQDFSGIETVACIGHEPSLSGMLIKFLGAKNSTINLKKSGAAVVKLRTWDKGELCAVLPPKMLRRLVDR